MALTPEHVFSAVMIAMEGRFPDLLHPDPFVGDLAVSAAEIFDAEVPDDDIDDDEEGTQWAVDFVTLNRQLIEHGDPEDATPDQFTVPRLPRDVVVEAEERERFDRALWAALQDVGFEEHGVDDPAEHLDHVEVLFEAENLPTIGYDEDLPGERVELRLVDAPTNTRFVPYGVTKQATIASIVRAVRELIAAAG